MHSNHVRYNCASETVKKVTILIGQNWNPQLQSVQNDCAKDEVTLST